MERNSLPDGLKKILEKMSDSRRMLLRLENLKPLAGSPFRGQSLPMFSFGERKSAPILEIGITDNLLEKAAKGLLLSSEEESLVKTMSTGVSSGNVELVKRLLKVVKTSEESPDRDLTDMYMLSMMHDAMEDGVPPVEGVRLLPCAKLFSSLLLRVEDTGGAAAVLESLSVVDTLQEEVLKSLLAMEGEAPDRIFRSLLGTFHSCVSSKSLLSRVVEHGSPETVSSFPALSLTTEEVVSLVCANVSGPDWRNRRGVGTERLFALLLSSLEQKGESLHDLLCVVSALGDSEGFSSLVEGGACLVSGREWEVPYSAAMCCRTDMLDFLGKEGFAMDFLLSHENESLVSSFGSAGRRMMDTVSAIVLMSKTDASGKYMRRGV